MKVVVFCGGSGTRLWPLGRNNFPKQFQKLVDERTMFQMTMDRLRAGFSIDDIFVCTGHQYRDIVLKQYPELPSGNIIEEPEMRDNAAAVAYSAAFIKAHFPGELMACIWGADHIIRQEDTFTEALRTAEATSKAHNALTFIGITLQSPNVHLGYIEMQEQIEERNGFAIYKFSSFKEKPDAPTAQKFFENPHYCANAGYFVISPDKLLGYYAQFAPSFYEKVEKILHALTTSGKSQIVRQVYNSFEKISVDHLIFEKLTPEEIYVIPAELGWSDIGAWHILYEEHHKDGKGNVIKGDHVGIDTKNCLIYGNPGKMIATVGLEDYIVVDTPDALLICPKDRDQDVKKIVKEHLVHTHPHLA